MQKIIRNVKASCPFTNDEVGNLRDLGFVPNSISQVGITTIDYVSAREAFRAVARQVHPITQKHAIQFQDDLVVESCFLPWQR
jgi:hypothetical protein